jgi:CRISPR-associated protein Cas5h
LQGARVSVGGPAPRRFWHKVKLRKDTPGPLPLTVKRGQKGTEAEKNRAALIHQEWLWEPDFLVHIALPDQPERFEELVERVRERGWHFSPCMGLSELLAEVEFVSCEQGRPLPAGLVEVHGTCLSAEAQLRAGQGVGLHMLRMPHHVSEDRVFTHAAYYVERQGQPFTVETARAWRVGDWTLMFS